MNRRVAIFVPLLALLVAVAAGAYWFVNRAPSRPIVGRAAPNFQLDSLSGQQLTLAAYRGHPVVVNFWATWCEPCKQEMPALQAEAASHPGLTILGVDNVEPAVKVKPFVQQLGITFPILLDQDGSVIEQYQVVGMPTSYFVDATGTLRAVYRGALDSATLQQNLTAIGV